MTKTEENAVLDLKKTISDFITHSNTKMKEMETQIQTLEKKLNKTPAQLESQMLSACQSSISDAIKSVLTGYSSPLSPLLLSVVEENRVELKQLIGECFRTTIRHEDFKSAVLQAFGHKIIRTITSGNDGMFDKIAVELKQDATFRAKATLAITEVVEQYLKEKSENA